MGWIFCCSLSFANGLMNLATLHSFTSAVQLVWYALAAAQMGAAIVIFIQHYRGVLKAGMQKLAIVTLIVMGSVFYVRQAMAGIPTGNTPSAVRSRYSLDCASICDSA